MWFFSDIQIYVNSWKYDEVISKYIPATFAAVVDTVTVVAAAIAVVVADTAEINMFLALSDINIFRVKKVHSLVI